MRLKDCYNFQDFRTLASQRLPAPIYNYIDGAADDEKTHLRNTVSFDRCDLVLNVLKGVKEIDMSVTVMGQNLEMPIYCSSTALQRLFHFEGERALGLMRMEIERNMCLMGCSSISELSLDNLRFR